MTAKTTRVWLLIVGLILLSGCSGIRSTVKHTILGEPTSSASQSSVFQVIRPDGTSVPMSVTALRALTYQQITLSGNHEAGPSVTDVLSAAGVNDFSQVTVTGSGGASITLTRDQLNNEVILSVNKTLGTAKLAAMTIPEPQWILNVNQVLVK
ncbi:MAG: hypothetical protein ABSF61_01685 [Anaerolineales bacterium]|jgi:hypothetical protein